MKFFNFFSKDEEPTLDSEVVNDPIAEEKKSLEEKRELVKDELAKSTEERQAELGQMVVDGVLVIKPDGETITEKDVAGDEDGVVDKQTA